MQQVVTPISKIIIDTDINTRPVAPLVVNEYAESIEMYGEDWQDNWGEYPKITLSNHLFSGFHSVAAAEKVFGKDHLITCIVEGKTAKDAFFKASKENGTHGRQRTNLEKRIAVLRWLLDAYGKTHTDGYIAEACNVSQNYVSSISIELETAVETDNLSNFFVPIGSMPDGDQSALTEYHRPSKRRYRRKGQWQYIETKEIGKKPEPKTADIKGMKENLYKHTSFARGDMNELVDNAVKYFHVSNKDAKAEVERLFEVRQSLLDQLFEIHREHVAPHLADILSEQTDKLRAALRKTFPAYREWETKEMLAVYHLEIMLEEMLKMREHFKVMDVEAIITEAFPETKDAEDESAVNWSPPSDLPESHQTTQIEGLVGETPNYSPEQEGESIFQPENKNRGYDELTNHEKIDVDNVLTAISILRRIEGLPDILKSQADYLQTSVADYKEGLDIGE